MAKAEITKYSGIIAWLFNARYLAYVYDAAAGGNYGSSNSEVKAIRKAQKAIRNSPQTYYVEVPVEAK